MVATSTPSVYYHEYQPDFDKDYAETQAFLEGKVPIKTARKIRIIVIGAGPSCLSFAREISEGRIENAELVVYEKNSGIGGTWWENRYTGCGCDIPSHNYQYTWAPNPDWSEYYSGAPEIRQYFQTVAKKYDIEKYVKLDHQVIGAQWRDSDGKWEVTVLDKATGQSIVDVVDILVNAGGIVNNWKWPNIEGLHSFKKELMHSAAWNVDYDFKNKNVVIIGNGSSGVQITPNLANIVDTMTVVMRSPTWIVPNFGVGFAGPDGKNFTYTEAQKREWRENPDEYHKYRRQIEEAMNKRKIFMKGSPEQREAREFTYNQMKNALAAKPELIEKLIPSFDVGCRRPSPGNGFLEALTQPNVNVSWGAPQRITEKSIVLHDGTEIEPDAIICATGFDLSYRPRFPIIGQKGMQLGDYWSPDPKAYMSFGVPNFPNYLHYLGPGGAASHGAIIPAIEQLTNYFVKIINKLQREGYQSFEPLQRCVDHLDAHHQDFIQHTVWSSHCASTFKNGKLTGRVNLLHGGSRLHYIDMLQEPRWEDYQWTVRSGGRLYDYFGDGRSRREAEEGGDIAWYMDNPDMQML